MVCASDDERQAHAHDAGQSMAFCFDLWYKCVEIMALTLSWFGQHLAQI